jgi:hypothetical protein
MDEISQQQIYDLALDILSDLARLTTSMDEVLLEMRSLNRDMISARPVSSESLPHFSGLFPT